MGGGAWAWLALTAAVSVTAGFLLGRVRWRRIGPASGPAPDVLEFLRRLAGESVPVDLIPRGGGAALRCVLRSADPQGLRCELAAGGRAGVSLSPGSEATCRFAPRRLNGRRVSGFAARVAEFSETPAGPVVFLSLPEVLRDLPRRRHARKRVSDQRFVRVRVWLADWETSGRHFPESAPDIWVNAYDDRRGDDNSVANISAGGLALEVRQNLLPEGLRPGCPVVLKCSLFLFRERNFRPYWYAGVVRAVDDSPGAGSGRTGGVRIAVAFTAVGRSDADAPQGVVWTRRIDADGPASLDAR